MHLLTSSGLHPSSFRRLGAGEAPQKAQRHAQHVPVRTPPEERLGVRRRATVEPPSRGHEPVDQGTRRSRLSGLDEHL